jgi:hypothetical protein
MKIGLMLEEIQVPPSQFVRIIGLGSRPALGAGEGGTSWKVQMDIESA